MKNKGFKEPTIPENLLPADNAEAIMEEAKVQETGIVQKRFKSIFLTKFDGTRISFRQVVFESCRFISCCFNEAEFTDVQFVNCDFSNTSLNDAAFKYCSFQNCKAVGTDFYGSGFRHVSFENCVITDAGFDAVRMSYMRTNHVDFTYTSFSKCSILNANWKDTCFQNVNFFKTSLKGIDFSDCNISGIGLSDGKLELQGIVVNMFQAVELAQRLGIVIKETGE